MNPIKTALESEYLYPRFASVCLAKPHNQPQAVMRLTFSEWEQTTDPKIGSLNQCLCHPTPVARLLSLDPDPAIVERWLEELAWSMGSIMLERICHPPDRKAVLGTRQDFGFALYMIGGQPDTMGDGYPELMELALERGYFWWRFAPGKEGSRISLRLGRRKTRPSWKTAHERRLFRVIIPVGSWSLPRASRPLRRLTIVRSRRL